MLNRSVSIPLNPSALLPLALSLSITVGAGVAWAESSARASARTASAAVQDGDWIQFRGPDGSGRAESVELVLPWPADGPPKLWSVPIGGGFSSISAAGETLYTLMSAGRDEFLVALDARSGEERWRLRTDDKRRDSFGDGPRSTPTVDGDRVYAVSALGHLWAVDRHEGKVLWDRDLRKEFGAMVPTWGVSASPVVDGDLVLFDVGGRRDHGIMAFHKKSGEVAWASDSGIPGYSSPLTVELDGARQSIFFTGSQLISLDPTNGRRHWSKPWKTAYDVNAAAPVHVPPDSVFVSSGYDTGASLLKVMRRDGALDVEEIWHTDSMKNQFSSSIYHDGHLYGFDDKELKCIDAETGEDRWRKIGFGHGSLILLGEHLAVLGDQGTLAVVAADPEGYREYGSFKVARGKHWTAPTYHRGRLLVRNQRELVAFQVGPPAAPAPPRPPAAPKAPPDR